MGKCVRPQAGRYKFPYDLDPLNDSYLAKEQWNPLSVLQANPLLRTPF